MATISWKRMSLPTGLLPFALFAAPSYSIRFPRVGRLIFGAWHSGSGEEDSDALDGGPVAFDDTFGPDEVGVKASLGDKLLVQDCTDLEWYKGRVIEAVPGQIKLHFVGWSSIWDEWIEADSRRLKAWVSNIRAKEEPATASESSRTKESWICTADMRGFDHASRHISQRVRIRDRFPRSVTLLRKALQEVAGSVAHSQWKGKVGGRPLAPHSR